MVRYSARNPRTEGEFKREVYEMKLVYINDKNCTGSELKDYYL